MTIWKPFKWLDKIMTINLYQKHADETSFVHMLDSTIRTLQSERWIGRIVGGRVTRALTELKAPKNLAAIGDLHGDLRSLKQILEDIDFEKFLSDFNNKLVFLGDYVDRGTESIEVLHTVCYLKQKYPDSVILMRGNHEAPTEFPFPSHDLPIKIQEHFGPESKNKVYGKILELFQLLTLVTLVDNKLFLVHGGLPTRIGDDYKEVISSASKSHKYDDTLEEILWNDPRPVKNEKWEVSRRLFGKHFGKEISKKWLKTTGTCAVVRSHEPCQRFRIDHEDMVMTIFSCKEPYPNFEPGYLFITGKQLEAVRNTSDLVQYIRKINGV
jgi:hypothetical protein